MHSDQIDHRSILILNRSGGLHHASKVSQTKAADRRPMPIDAIDDAADFSKLRAPSA